MARNNTTQNSLGRRDNQGRPSFTPARQGQQPDTPPATPVTPTSVSASVSASDGESPSQSSDALIWMCLDPTVSMQSLAEVAIQNPDLGKCYQQAAVRTGTTAVNSISQAVLAIGLDEARILAFVQAVTAVLPDVLSASDRDRLLESCLRRGIISERIAEDTGMAEVWPAFALGFVAELGLLYLSATHPHLSDALMSLAQHPGSERASAERLMTGSDHGAAIADSPLGTAFPDPMRAVLRTHHTDPSPLGLIIAAADRVSDLIHAPSPLEYLPITEQAIRVAGGRTPVQQVLHHATARILHLSSLLQFPIQQQPDPTLLLQPPPPIQRHSVNRTLFSRGNRGSHASGRHLLANLDNRARLGSLLQTFCQRGEAFSVIFINFDGFRRINDTFGVPAGDRVIGAVAVKLQSCLTGPSDRMARLGGDRFAVLLPRATPRSGQVTAERIRSLIQRNHVHLGGNIRVACSVTLYGASLNRTESKGTNGDEVLARMENGLDEASRRSRNRTTWA